MPVHRPPASGRLVQASKGVLTALQRIYSFAAHLADVGQAHNAGFQAHDRGGTEPAPLLRAARQPPR